MEDKYPHLPICKIVQTEEIADGVSQGKKYELKNRRANDDYYYFVCLLTLEQLKSFKDFILNYKIDENKI